MTAILFVKNCTDWYPSPITIEILREAFEVYGPNIRIKRKSKWGNGNLRSALIYFESMENMRPEAIWMESPFTEHTFKSPMILLKSTRGKGVRLPSRQVAAVPVQGLNDFSQYVQQLQGGKFLLNEMVHPVVPVETRTLVDNLKLSANFEVPIF
ncbi:LOW QUALITY PROTEIN: hypothetical protein DAPPUDRAFT_245103 [Daphnia pulex]|uniref:RRM domain-containing protein n=1 Tax=Daphnia pulex TaxID=6669 RepID=E9GMK2_DAPPU|nr:LOW QUALITY PROTEIN: hypothetical protein DAPPUDRAFT_245103 [Daphnia pulex]|eukprot:EFX79113.1 LOW QUALITY PROTEIN: hypothetical protein DAPPUDRAFT_245103 [Daphnia pulex]